MLSLQIKTKLFYSYLSENEIVTLLKNYNKHLENHIIRMGFTVIYETRVRKKKNPKMPIILLSLTVFSVRKHDKLSKIGFSK